MRTGTRRGAVAVGWAAAMAVVGCASGTGSGVGARPVVVGAGVERRVARFDDSVQVGYGMQGRRRMTGSVSSVSGDVVRAQHVVRVEELLMRVPGVAVSPRSDGTYSVIVRGAATLSPYGNTDPLVVIDGMPVSNGLGALRAMAAEDVERIDVLKDAEASIYGSRSANGVILVRTRHMKPSQE